MYKLKDFSLIMSATMFNFLTLNFCKCAMYYSMDGLIELQEKLNMNHSRCCGEITADQLTPASTILRTGFYKYFTGDAPIMVQRMDYHEGRMGNFIGNYFDDISCAAISGLHFVGIHPKFSTQKSPEYNIFWESLPTIIYNPNASTLEEAMAIVNSKCTCERYCWYVGDPWMYQIPLIRSIMLQGLHMHLSIKDHTGISMQFQGHQYNPSTDMASLSVQSNDFLPFFPDVAIHYRCSDNLYGGMGLMSFGTLIENIPHEAKYIYIFTEYGSRLNGTPLEHAAQHILTRLLHELQLSFPTSKILIKRGGQEFTVWAQLAFANTTICSPSTFCLWPALARSGVTYMPATDYIAHDRSKPNNNFPIHPNFHWIFNPHIYNNFTRETKVGDIIDTLIFDIPSRS